MTRSNRTATLMALCSCLALAVVGGQALAVVVAVRRPVPVRTTVAYRPVPVAGAAVATTAAVATAVAVGTVVATLPRDCRSVVVGNVAYQQCGATWYQPRYAGAGVTYVVVAPPR